MSATSLPNLEAASAIGDADLGAGADVFRRLLKERIVFLGSAIDQNSANLICSQLILLEAEDHEQDISVYINSPGGSVTPAWPSTTPCSTCPVTCARSASGLAASMGQFLLCAGTPGKRFALPHTRILMHQPSGRCRGRRPTSPSRPSRSST